MNNYRLFRKDQWVKSTRNVQMDDLDYVLRNRWPMGRVTEVFCGEDGGVRSVKKKNSKQHVLPSGDKDMPAGGSFLIGHVC